MATAIPLALIVDDDNKTRETRSKILEESNFIAIGASTRNDALREIKASPAIDIIITDISLKPDDYSDNSGYLLAKDISKLRPNLPIIGYSGKVKEFPNEYNKVFIDSLERGSNNLKQLRQHVQKWRDLALKYRKIRTERATENLGRIKEKYKLSSHDYNILREFVPDAISHNKEQNEYISIEDVLRNAGFHLQIIDDYPDLPIKGKIIAPIAIWLQEIAGGAIAQVYGFPDLYSSGVDSDEAIRNLLILIYGYYTDIKSEKDKVLSRHVKSMKNYLIKIFG